MAAQANPIDPKTGFCPATTTFHSLRPAVSLIPPDQPLSFVSFALHLLSRHLPAYADHATTTTAIIDAASGLRISFAEFVQQVGSLAACLRSLHPSSLSKGRVAFVLASNSAQVPVLYLALLSLGVVISPVNPLGTSSDISRQIGLSRPDIVFATPATANKLPRDLPLVLLHTPEFERMLVADSNADVVFSSPSAILQSDPAAILYSSGTTGQVKGVLLSHRNLIAAVSAMVEKRASPKINLMPTPFFHVFGFTILLGAVAIGETVVLMERFDLGQALCAVEKFKVTHMPVAPPVIAAMARSEANHDLSSLEVVTCGGSPLSRKLFDMFTAKFPWVSLQTGLGMTEAGPVALTWGLKDLGDASLVGLLSPNMEAKIIDTENGRALLPGQRGELWLRGPTIMQGYIGDEAAASGSLDSEGWLRTGDVCYFDDNGCLHVVDRLKQMIKYKGYQVPPAELEQLLLNHPEILDAAVIPYPDEEAGEIPMAFVVRASTSALNHSQVMDFVTKHVAPYKKIRKVAFMDAIPKNPTGKVLRKELIKIAVSRTDSKL